ncbi:hypothetical protein GQ457_17G004810 [Hibiscus cannabinus]
MSSPPSSLLPHALSLVSPGGRPPDDPSQRDKSLLDGHSQLSGVAVENRVLPSIEDPPLTMVDLVGVVRSTHNSSEDASADEVMVESNIATGKTDSGPSRVSYAGMVRRNPNVNGKNAADSWEWNADDVKVLDDDYVIDRTRPIPSIKFSDRVHDQIDRSMRTTNVVRLLGRSIGFRTLQSRLTALWKLNGNFQLIDLENGFFLVRLESEDDYTRVLTDGPWMVFATVIGRVVKIDYNTFDGARGKFARLAVMVDLTKPLLACIRIDGKIQKVEYEGLQQICFQCGTYGHAKENCVGSGGSPGFSINDNGKNLGQASTSTNPVEPSDLAPYGPWMTVDNRRRKTMRGSVVAKRSGTNSVQDDGCGQYGRDHMQTQGHKEIMKGGNMQTKVAQDLISTGSRFAALRMEDRALFMESDVEETCHVTNSMSVGNMASGGTHAINSKNRPAQGSSIATMNGDSVGSKNNVEQLEELPVSEVSIGLKNIVEQVKELPVTEVSVGLKNHMENLKVVLIMADHVVEILSQESVGCSDKHMAIMLSERKQTKSESAGGKIVKARSWVDRSSDEGYRKGFHLRKQAVVKSRPLSAIQEWAQNLSNQLESNAVNMGNAKEEANDAFATINASSLTKGVVVAEAHEPLELTAAAVGKGPLEPLKH